MVDTKNGRLLVANQSNDTLDVVDLKSGKLVRAVPGQKQIHGVAYAPALERIFVGNGAGLCNALDGREYRLLRSNPVPGADSVRYDPRTNHVFVASNKALAVIDAKTFAVLGSIEVPASVYGFQVAARRPRLYVNNGAPCRVTVIDTDKNEVVAGFPLGGHQGIGPLGLDEANGRIFVGLRRTPRLAVLDQESGKECASVPIPEGSDDLFLDAKAKRLYISCNSGFVAVIRQVDADHYEALPDVATVKGAKTSAYDAATQRLYVAVPRPPGKEAPEIWVYQARP
jgi:DNA-binding beta-propeller fold protein YncE